LKVLHFAVAASLLFLSSCIADAQGKIELGAIPSSQVETKPTNCELNSSKLSGAHQAAAATGHDTIIIAIARLGDGERRAEVNRRRLHNVRVFLAEAWKRSPLSVVLAQGERVRGYGRVELYVGGRLFELIAVKTNGDLPVSLTCEPDTIRPTWFDRNLYPYVDRNRSRRR
jgi:hypothetical protein